MEKDQYRESINRVVSHILRKTSEIADCSRCTWTDDVIDSDTCPAGIGTEIGRLVGRFSGSVDVSSAAHYLRRLLR